MKEEIIDALTLFEGTMDDGRDEEIVDRVDEGDADIWVILYE